jgi:hypothetical protein
LQFAFRVQHVQLLTACNVYEALVNDRIAGNQPAGRKLPEQIAPRGG